MEDTMEYQVKIMDSLNLQLHVLKEETLSKQNEIGKHTEQSYI